MIEITQDAIKRVEKILAGVNKGAERALSNSINRGLSRVKTGAVKRVKEVYTVQNSAFANAANIKTVKANTGNLSGFISFSGHKIPLYKFSVTPKDTETRKQVRAAVKKGGGTAFEHAFIAEINGRMGIFERKTSSRFPVEEKMGLAAAQMVRNEKIIEPLEKETQELFNKRLEHEIERILNGN